MVRVAAFTLDCNISEESAATSVPRLLGAMEVRNNAGLNNVDGGPEFGVAEGEVPVEPTSEGLTGVVTGTSESGGIDAGGVGTSDGGDVGATPGVMVNVPLAKANV